MVCSKCGYADKKEIEKFGFKFCSICAAFVPDNKKSVQEYVLEKIDWKILDIFRKFNCYRGKKQRNGMRIQAKEGHPVNRPPLGYSITKGQFSLNSDSLKVISMFRTFLNQNFSLNAISKQFGVSVNGLKKILMNRCYLGEIKFSGKIYKSNHKPLIDNETFYAVQRKIKQISRPRNKKITNLNINLSK